MVTDSLYRWLLGACLLAGYFSGSLPAAQEKDPAYQALVASAQQHLKSDDSREVAWAAYRAGEHRLAECVPGLLKLVLSSPESKPTKIRQALSRIATASLIEIQPLLPKQELQALLDSRRDVLVIVLASRAPEKYEEILLNLFNQTQTRNHRAWIAACNLLTEIRSKKLVVELMKQIRIKLTLRVYPEGIRGGESRSRLARRGGRHISNPVGFPPIVYHSLDLKPLRGSRVLAPGLIPVYLFTQKRDGQGLSIGLATDVFDHNYHKLKVLLHFVNKTMRDIDLYAEIRWSAGWKGEASLKQTVFEKLDHVKEKWALVAEKLVTRGMLSTLEADKLQVQMTLNIVDRRGKTEPALPEGEEMLKLWRKAVQEEVEIF